jgi:hypothetical protein
MPLHNFYFVQVYAFRFLFCDENRSNFKFDLKHVQFVNPKKIEIGKRIPISPMAMGRNPSFIWSQPSQPHRILPNLTRPC